MVCSREIDSEGKMLGGVPLGPVDSYIHSGLFSTGISIESFLGKYSADRYASVASVICRWHMQWERGWQGQRASASPDKINLSDSHFEKTRLSFIQQRNVGCTAKIDK